MSETYSLGDLISTAAIAVAVTNLVWTVMMQIIIHKLKERLTR